MNHKFLKFLMTGAAYAGAFSAAAYAQDFNIPSGDLRAALESYVKQSGVALLYPEDEVSGTRTKGVSGSLSSDEALSRLLKGTRFTTQRGPSGAIGIVERTSQAEAVEPIQLAQATASVRATVETVTVTSSKLGGADVQSIPIAITALSQEQLTATQTAGGPDLVKQVPNLTFTKTNFTGFSINIRGIGTQAISVTTDPAVAVAFNDIPFIRNHFFEQEFYDVGQVEVLRGPQGTLYGRNATAGVVNLSSARPTDQFEAMLSGEIGNYHQHRFEGMINLPIVDDRLDIRIAGEWTKRQGYSFNDLTDQRIDGRNLWSGRVTIALKPVEDLQLDLVWEHFSENDDRMRTSKQLCKTQPTPSDVGGEPGAVGWLSQGCEMTSLYSPDAFQVPNGYALPYYFAIADAGAPVNKEVDPYASTTQSRNLRVIESTLNPIYKVKNDVIELNTNYRLRPSLTFTSQTGFSHDFMWSTEDYNRFNTAPGVFLPTPGTVDANGVFCDPQIGCSNRLVAQDLSDEHAWQLSQEVRLASDFSGPFNFSVGGNYLHYETEENFYVFINSLTLFSIPGGPYIPGVTDGTSCLRGRFYRSTNLPPSVQGCHYIDPNPITSLNNEGHNYFLSQNPYLLQSYATFGEVYYDLASNLKLTAGLRWTEDRKHFSLMPSWVVIGDSWGYPVTGVVDNEWDQFTGRINATWTPDLPFTDKTFIYSSYSHGYKAGGANPPGAVEGTGSGQMDSIPEPVHPLLFKPEFVDAFEVGTKNTLLDGSVTLNANLFYYNYEQYQISQIVDRTSINLNFDAHVKGAEIEATWEPLPGLRFNFAGGYEDTSIARGSRAIDLIDRTASDPNWIVLKPSVDRASNCILPVYVVAQIIGTYAPNLSQTCDVAYVDEVDPVTRRPYEPNPSTDMYGTPLTGYPGFDPAAAPNHGEGIAKDLSGNELPNAPPFTVSVGSQFSVPLTADWAGTLRGDFYWQDNSWARVWNDDPYDRLHGYTNINLALIFTSQSGWQVMLYDKNVFDTTAITGTFLNSDDTGLTTNVFLTDPKLIGVRVTKNW